MSCLAHPGSGKRSSLTSDLVGSPPPKSSTAHRLNTPSLKKPTALSPWAHQWVNMLFRAFSVCKQLKNSCVFSIRVQIILFVCSQPTLQSHLKTARLDRKTVFSSPEMILHTKFADVSSLNKREGSWWNRRAKHCRDRKQKLTSNVRSVKHMKIFWRLLFFYFLNHL